MRSRTSAAARRWAAPGTTQGKLLNKKNTFTDFIDVTGYLVAQGYAAKDRVAALGGSAGGLLMGAVANMAPQDYRVIIAQVPFVDVVTTMLDATIPLTTNEYDEWGNPEQQQYYDYMLSYSPYDNVARAGLSGDVRRHRPVGQPGAVLRAGQVRRASCGDQDRHAIRCCFRINMEAGPRRQVGPLPTLPRVAEYYAFMLDQLGRGECSTSTGHSPGRGQRG